MSNPMPVLFVAHGAPPLLDDETWMRQLRDWSATLPRPKAILILSAHWIERPLTLGATKPVPLIYDFSGFPERFYRLTYPAPGAPELAEETRRLLAPLGPVADAPARGFDHGVWIPLSVMFPRADIPVLQLSLPSLEPHALFAVGRALAPLRDQGVLIVATGHLTHNLGRIDFGARPATPAWASELDGWVKDVLERRDVDALLDYRRRAPGVREALPTHEHFVPLVVAVGAAADSPGAITFPVEGWFGGSLSKRSVQLD